MICPRCSVAEISAETNQCVLCGYSAVGTVGVQIQPREELHDHALRELGEQFRIERLLGQGPRSLVYVAREVETERKVALKVIARQPVRGAGLEDRFSRDAATAASLDHPHIVPIYRFGTTAHVLWYSMKYVEGARSLGDILRETGPLELHACLRIVEQLASALQYAHRRGMIHGDVRPANVLIDAQDWALVTDFAIGRLLERLPVLGGSGTDAAPPPPGRRPEYVAPEEAFARQPGPAADQYSLAVLVYECLAGAPPAQPPQPLVAVRPEIPVPLADALLRAMRVQPTARFMNVLEFVSVLGTSDAGGGLLAGGGGLPGGGVLPRTSPRPSSSQRVLFVDGPARSRRWIGVTAGVLAVSAALAAVLWLGKGPAPVSPSLIEMPQTQPVAPAPVDSPQTRAPATVPAPRPTTPAPRPQAPRQAPPRSQPPPSLVPGHLFINVTPWGQLYIDDQLIGNTPLANLEIAAGAHRFRIVRDGFRTLQLDVDVAPGQEVRLTNLVLQPVRP